MKDYKDIASEYYNKNEISKEFRMKAILEQVYQDGFEQGIEFAVSYDTDNIWHKKTKDGWTDWELSQPPAGDLIVTVCDDTGDNTYYYTIGAWYLNGYWIADNDVLDGVVAWKRFPKPCKEK